MCKETNQNDQSNVENKNLIDDKRFYSKKFTNSLKKKLPCFGQDFGFLVL